MRDAFVELQALRARREREMTSATVRGLELDYESFGDAGAPTILLIMGLGMPGIASPDPVVDGLVAAGFRVIRFDNRDCGRSGKLAGVACPTCGWPSRARCCGGR